MSDGGMTSTALRYVEVCAGAGGMGLGLHLAGWTGTGMELDADAVATHSANVGPCEAGDLTTWHPPHRADLVAGGVPCQSFSQAGNRGGLGDPRGQLFRHLLRVAREADARVVLMENVQGLVHMGVLPLILTAFADAGFDPVHALLCAADYGVPQNRVRLFIAGFRDADDLARFRWPAPSHGAPGNLYGLPRWRTVRDALALPAGDYAHGLLPHASAASPQGMRVLDVDAPAPTVGGHTADLLDRPSPTVTGQCQDLSFGSAKVRDPLRAALAASGLLDRPAMTVTQLAALQSFPADFAFTGTTTAQHRQVGNAVPVLLAKALGSAIRQALYVNEGNS